MEQTTSSIKARTASVTGEDTTQSERHLLLAFIATFSVVAAILVGAAFVTWVNLDNSITWPLDEAGGTAVYPQGHFLSGDLLAAGLAVIVTVLVMSVWVILPGQFSRVAKGAYGWNLLWLGASLGLFAIVMIRYSVYLASPLLISALVAWIVLTQTGKRNKLTH